ncbi:g9032 [Coccomyxa elongata]
MPADALACVASYLKPGAQGSARLVCRSWKRGISLGITKLQPRLQSPLGNHVSLYLTKLRWDEIKLLLAAFSGCQELNLTNATMTADCAQHLVAGHSLARIKVRSDCFKPTSSRSAFEELQAFTETLQAQAPNIIIDLEVHVNSVEFRTSFDSSLQPLVKLPSNVKAVALELMDISPTPCQMLDVAHFKHLRALNIAGQRLCANSAIEDSTFKLLGQLALLENLSLSWLSHVSDEGLLEGLIGLKKLHSLVLVDVTKVTDNVIKTLQATWSHLGSLSLSNCYLLTDASLSVFESLPCLYNLFLSGNGQLSSLGMARVKQRVKLTTFRQCGVPNGSRRQR